MYTTLSGGEVETGDLESRLNTLQTQAASLQAKIDALNSENNTLLRKMSQAKTTAEYESYRSKYNTNKDKVKDLQSQLDEVNESIQETKQAIDEAKEGEKAKTDDYTRIPQLMKAMKDAYGITWANQGSWSGYTFIREGTIGSVKGQVTFKATVSIARKPKYFMGIKIHRAIVQINWELTSSWSDTSVAEVLDLDPEDKRARQGLSEL